MMTELKAAVASQEELQISLRGIPEGDVYQT